MSVERVMSTLQLTLPGIDVATRCPDFRPPHYLVIVREYDDDPREKSEPEYHVETTTHDLDFATAEAEFYSDGECSGAVLDNWSGVWVRIPPDWADDVEVMAEGFARYDLRPR